MEDQRIRDPIHNLIKFSSSSEEDEILWRLIQSSPVQRLRRIKQLGFSEFVYPGASHTRFSHSLGAMQMARRMIEVLTKNDVVGKDSDFLTWKCATLCAALLHDVGHGPYSHVFEKVSRKLGFKTAHEAYTLRIIEEKEISEILNEKSGLRTKTLSFFNEEPGKRIYSSIVSSQLDADRLDFLCRDRYFSGIRFGELDLEWLFDSLRVTKQPIDPLDIESDIEVPTFVIQHKGLSVAEDYLASYSHMYSSVYFHKATRGIEILVSEILTGILENKSDYEKTYPKDPIINYFKDPSDKPELASYLSLDDSTVLSFIHRVAMGKFGEPSNFANRFLNRELLKCFEIPRSPNQEPLTAKPRMFRQELDSNKIRYFWDKAPLKGYKQYEIADNDFLKNILVWDKGHAQPSSIGKLSNAVEHFTSNPTIRFYFLSDEDRRLAQKIWNGINPVPPR